MMASSSNSAGTLVAKANVKYVTLELERHFEYFFSQLEVEIQNNIILATVTYGNIHTDTRNVLAKVLFDKNWIRFIYSSFDNADSIWNAMSNFYSQIDITLAKEFIVEIIDDKNGKPIQSFKPVIRPEFVQGTNNSSSGITRAMEIDKKIIRCRQRMLEVLDRFQTASQFFHDVMTQRRTSSQVAVIMLAKRCPDHGLTVCSNIDQITDWCENNFDRNPWVSGAGCSPDPFLLDLWFESRYSLLTEENADLAQGDKRGKNILKTMWESICYSENHLGLTCITSSMYGAKAFCQMAKKDFKRPVQQGLPWDPADCKVFELVVRNEIEHTEVEPVDRWAAWCALVLLHNSKRYNTLQSCNAKDLGLLFSGEKIIPWNDKTGDINDKYLVLEDHMFFHKPWHHLGAELAPLGNDGRDYILPAPSYHYTSFKKKACKNGKFMMWIVRIFIKYGQYHPSVAWLYRMLHGLRRTMLQMGEADEVADSSLLRLGPHKNVETMKPYISGITTVATRTRAKIVKSRRINTNNDSVIKMIKSKPVHVVAPRKRADLSGMTHVERTTQSVSDKSSSNRTAVTRVTNAITRSASVSGTQQNRVARKKVIQKCAET